LSYRKRKILHWCNIIYTFQTSVPCCEQPRHSNCIYELSYNSGRQIIRVYIIIFILPEVENDRDRGTVFYSSSSVRRTVSGLMVFFVISYDGRVDLSECILMNIVIIYCDGLRADRSGLYMGCVLGNARKCDISLTCIYFYRKQKRRSLNYIDRSWSTCPS